MVANASTWTEIDVTSDVNLTGTVGLVLELPNTPEGNYWGRDETSSDEISWFINLDEEWVQLGYENYTDYPGDWNLKAHLLTFRRNKSTIIHDIGKNILFEINCLFSDIKQFTAYFPKTTF